MLAALHRPTIFAHRGSSFYAPENTLAAFKLAVDQGADGIELDVQLSRDKQVVVIHDNHVDRTTDGIGRVADLPLATLKQLDAGAFFDCAFAGERIPTLEEVFETVGKRTIINIELKNNISPVDNLPETVALIIQKHHMEARILFSSFNIVALIKAKRLLPQIPCGLLAESGLLGGWARSWGRKISGFEALHPNASSVNARLVTNVHQDSQRLHVYTVNEADEMKRLYTLGVDGIFSDNPVLALQVRAQLGK
jgi:glycerophosphoryl diester phosphodiesterase